VLAGQRSGGLGGPCFAYQRLDLRRWYAREPDFQAGEAAARIHAVNGGGVPGIGGGRCVGRLLGDAEDRGGLVAAHADKGLAAHLPQRHLEPDWGAIGGAGAAAGVLAGGMLTTWLGWRAVFLVNVPVGVVAALVSLRQVPVTPVRRTR